MSLPGLRTARIRLPLLTQDTYVVEKRVPDWSVGGANSAVGGLVGWSGGGSITSSYATGNVTGTGVGISIGGLVGSTFFIAIIDSQAFGNVTAGSTGTGNDVLSDNKGVSKVGGLVGNNGGSIVGTTAVTLSSHCTTGASFSCATGTITVGSGSSAGGLVKRQGLLLDASNSSLVFLAV